MLGMKNPLGIVAGGGHLPAQLAAAAKAAGREVFIAGIEGYADPALLRPFSHRFYRLGAVGAMINAFRAHGCTDLVMIGPVKRPSFLSLRPDAEGARLLARIGKAAFLGDDGLLAAIVAVLSDEGFRVLGAHEIMSDAVVPGGLLTKAAPDALAMADIERGVAVLKLIGAADIGQACVVQQGLVLAVETVEGTDAMLERIPLVARPGPAGILVKIAKPQQERRADMPTIGPQTIRHALKVGLRGLAFEAGGTILVDREMLVQRADQDAFFLLAVEV